MAPRNINTNMTDFWERFMGDRREKLECSITLSLPIFWGVLFPPFPPPSPRSSYFIFSRECLWVFDVQAHRAAAHRSVQDGKRGNTDTDPSIYGGT